MSVLSGLGKGELKASSDGLLELPPEKLRSIMRSEPITDVYHVEQTPFARGKFASVRKLRHLVSGQEYAAKFIRKRRRAADTSREIHHEVAVLALCDGCDRVVRLHEVYETRTEVAIVLELCAGGELQRVLDSDERLAEGAARRALRHALEGLAHLHARRIAHLDLKPQNLLLTADGDQLLICDFGISRAIHPGAHVREILGTRDYVAPEILSYEPLTLAADVWSVGVLAYVLLSGYSPFAGDTKQETYLNIAQGQLSFPRDLFRGVSGAAIQFIKDTLVVDPKGRLTVEECLEHPWLKDASDLPPTIVGVPLPTAEAADNEDSGDETENTDYHNGTNGTPNGVNGTTKTTITVNGKENEITGKENGISGKENGINGTDNIINGIPNGLNGTKNGIKVSMHENGTAINGTIGTKAVLNGTNGINGTTNGYKGSQNGKNGSKCLGNGTSNGINGCSEIHEQENECVCVVQLPPPFPDAPSTPKVLRKSPCASVLALCQKFQPPPPPPPRRPDRPLIC